jgi:putative ABC transport system substrate-binding protein
VIAAGGGVAAKAAKVATATIPVVFTTGADPVMTGLVASLNRPGANVTGATAISAELASKRLELVRMLMPQARMIAMLINPSFPSAEFELADVEAAARTLEVQVRRVTASNEREIDSAFTTIATTRVDALIIGTDGYFIDQRDQITAFAARLAIPTIYFFRDFAVAGGLMSYAPSLADTYRQAWRLRWPNPQGRQAG